MILATMRLTVQTEKRDEFLRSVHGVPGAAHDEPGCISRRLYQDVDNKNAFAFVEEWESQADLDHHIRRETFRMLITVMDILSEPPEVMFNEVSHTAGLEAVSSAFEKDRHGNGNKACI
jgi:quinol monooxygenase YgiN